MSRPKIVLLGMLTKIPVGGVIWLVAQYMEGFRRLGFDPYYVEAHARTPSMFMDSEDDDPTALAVRFLDAQMRRFGFGGQWAFHALHDDGSVHGPVADRLGELYRDAALIVNMHGGTIPLDEHAATGRLVYLGTDPVELELEVHRGEQRTLDFLDAHCAYFTWGLNQGSPDCRVPSDDRYPLIPSPPPVILDWWENDDPPGDVFTTIGNWRQPWRTVEFEGNTYTWSKHHEFLKVLDLPTRMDQQFELALSSFQPADKAMLEANRWRVRPAIEMSRDADSYRAYIQNSRGEFSVAKDQNVRLRSGWFSERSATYLAAGRPVVLQDTGYGSFLPTGAGLHAFADVEEAAAIIDEINGDLRGESRGARAVAKEHLSSDVVLTQILDQVGIEVPAPRGGPTVMTELPADLELTPLQRRPLVLPPRTIERVLERPLPDVSSHSNAGPEASIVMVVKDNLVLTRLAAESVLRYSDLPFELVLVDNASEQDTRDYVSALAEGNGSVRAIVNDENRGFAAAVNQGLLASRGDMVVIANNDIIVTPGWLSALRAHLAEPGVGAVGPVTNRCGNDAEVDVAYSTYREMLTAATKRRAERAGENRPLPMLAMFCTALRRDVVERIGPLDERFGLGLFEDDDYARRITNAGLELLCADDVFVHHFGEGTFSGLFADGTRSVLFERNRERYEKKWGIRWEPHVRRSPESYDLLVREVREALSRSVPESSEVAVVSKGDDHMLAIQPARARHFPSAADGSYVGHHPADDVAAIAELERLRAAGVDHIAIPATSFWWLGHYRGFMDHLAQAGSVVIDDDRLLLVALETETERNTMDEASPPEALPTHASRTPLPVCILGMHRSGTSLITRLLNIVGVDLGPRDHLMKWLAGNPRGHWEHEGILDINKEILDRVGGRWDDVPVFPEAWATSPGFADLRARARTLIDDDFRDSELWGWKDPRTSLTLPFWKQVVGPMRYVVCIRNPIDVTRSLTSREKESVDVETAHRLWLSYLQGALRHSADGERLIVFYEDVMDDWRPALRRVATFLGIDGWDEGVDAQIDEFLAGDLWHHRSTVADVLDDGELGFGIKATYLALRLASQAEGDEATAWTETLTEFAAEALAGRDRELDRARIEAAEQEAREAWQLLRKHRARLGRVVATSKRPGERIAHREYSRLTKNIQEHAGRVLPADATVLVVSKGDQSLLEIPGVEAWHFPRNDLGEYAGFHPATGREAVEHLQKLRARGGTHLLLPRPYAWWLEHYEELATYLNENARLLGDSEHGWIYEFVDEGA